MTLLIAASSGVSYTQKRTETNKKTWQFEILANLFNEVFHELAELHIVHSSFFTESFPETEKEPLGPGHR